MASGGRVGMAQSVFQVGGNAGQAVGPLLAAFLVLPRGQSAVAWVSFAPLLAMAVLWKVGQWYQARRPVARAATSGVRVETRHPDVSEARVKLAIGVLVALIFSKFFYLASLSSYYTFYLISKFHVSVQDAQVDLFIFLVAVAAGTILGGPIGDRIGRKLVIWVSILGVFLFSMALPFASLFWTRILTVVIGLILSSAFSAIVVYESVNCCDGHRRLFQRGQTRSIVARPAPTWAPVLLVLCAPANRQWRARNPCWQAHRLPLGVGPQSVVFCLDFAEFHLAGAQSCLTLLVHRWSRNSFRQGPRSAYEE